MRSWIIAFVIGIVFLQQFSALPSVILAYAVILLTIFLFFTARKYWSYLRLPVAGLLGFAWALVYAQWHFQEKLLPEFEGKPLVITGYIHSIPMVETHGVGFLFLLTSLAGHPAHGVIKLLWGDNTVVLHAGDKWQFTAKLKKPYGTMNPGGFDYEAYAFTNNIIANGYIANKEPTLLLSSHWYHQTLNRIRQYFAEKISQNLPASETSPWITALAIGERHDIPAPDWQVLRNTGTNHLMAIAGLHIGFIALLAHVVVTFCWRRIPRAALKMPAQHAGAVAALVMAFIYSAMAGFSIPTQRACVMIAAFLTILLLRRKPLSWQGWSVALLCVVLINPLTVLSESFWLSFASVALIIYCMSGRLAPQGLWWKLGRIQWIIAVGLLPLSIWLFQQCAFISFIANSVAIPWVGFLVAPLSFLGALLMLVSIKLGTLILIFADKILSVLWIFLAWCAHLPNVVWYQVVDDKLALLAGCVAVVILLLPAGFPGRYFSVIFVLPIVLFTPLAPAAGGVWFTLLDIGQGLSAVIQTQKHILVFDAGPRLSVNYDMGESVVVPFLHTLAAKRIDMLVISHGDNDHIGGANALLRNFPVSAIKTSVPELLPHADYCLQGLKWRWDGVDFEFIYPFASKLHLGNNSSCVLRVSSGAKHILLTGDIEKLAEKSLLASAENLPATILIAPHHGSKTSANENFITRVHPRYVLFPVGYRNRYHFPNKTVVEKYAKHHVLMLDTVNSGAIKFVMNENALMPPDLYRMQHKHYWNN
ncbi:MAG: DNA internalization-related competence protein ComEC/Rec2 [Pseudomonadota bacterium]